MKYVAPQTKNSEVELENNFCGSVFVDKEDSEDLPIENQTKGEEFDFGGSTWD